MTCTEMNPFPYSRWVVPANSAGGGTASAADDLAGAHAREVEHAAHAIDPEPVMDAGLMLVTVHDQQVAAVGGLVQDLMADLYAVAAGAEAVAKIGVVVAGNVDDTGAGARLGQDGADHGAVRGRPMPAAAQALDVKDVADEIERLGLIVGQKIQQIFSFAET